MSIKNDWEEALYSTECDKEKIEYHMMFVYNWLRLPVPKLIWVPNPWILSDLRHNLVKPEERISLSKIIFSLGHKKAFYDRVPLMSFLTNVSLFKKPYGLNIEDIIGREPVSHCYRISIDHMSLRGILRFNEKELCPSDDLILSLTYLCKHNPFFVLTDEFVIISEKHKTIYCNEDRPHRLNGPAVSFEGVDLYALFGIQLRKKYVYPDKLDFSDILRIRNVNIRSFLLDQIGREKVLYDKRVRLIEEKSNYKLINIGKIVDMRYAPCLVMKNPSTNELHVEGVGEECLTIQQAINWRAGDIRKSWRPITIT